MTSQPDIISEMLYDLLVAVESAGGVITHPQVVTVAFKPLEKYPLSML
jgi:hypothetical protein